MRVTVQEVMHLLEVNLIRNFLRSKEFAVFLTEGAEPVEFSACMCQSCVVVISLCVAGSGTSGKKSTTGHPTNNVAQLGLVSNSSGQPANASKHSQSTPKVGTSAQITQASQVASPSARDGKSTLSIKRTASKAAREILSTGSMFRQTIAHSPKAQLSDSRTPVAGPVEQV